MLERNGHGGDWATAAELYDCGSGPLLDYSANINPFGPPVGIKELVEREWEFVKRYPDPEVHELRSAIAEVYWVSSDSIIVGNGAAEIIDLLVRMLRPRKVALIEPAFVEYREAAEKIEADIVSVAASADRHFIPDLQTVLAAVTDADVLFLGQPNNPTGTRWERKELELLVRQAERHNTRIVLDEAFIDFFEDEQDVTMIREAEQNHHVFVIRSMTKFYAIPGLRLGYAVAHPSHVKAMKRLQVPWSVNHFAQKAGVLALQDIRYAERTRELIAAERAWLASQLIRLGCLPFSGAANFLLVRLGSNHPNAAELQRALGRQGILIRNCATFRGLDDAYFRLAVRTRAENERLVSALAAALR